jgi:hypothetical protein
MGADLRQEPRTAAARRSVSEVHDQASEPPASEAALVGRAFFTTDPESRLYRKAAGREARLCYLGHVTMENWHGLAVAGTATKANGAAERHAAQAMPKAKRIAWSSHYGRRGQGHDAKDHIENPRAIGITPHVVQNKSPTKTGKRRRSAAR